MPILEVQESNFTVIPDGTVLHAEVTGVKEINKGPKDKPWVDDNGDLIKRMEFAFVITEADSEFSGLRQWGDTPLTFSTNPDCKLRNWAQAILGFELPAKTQLDTDDLKGLSCRIVVSHRKQKEGDEKIWTFISDVLPAEGTNVRPSFMDDSEPF